MEKENATVAPLVRKVLGFKRPASKFNPPSVTNSTAPRQAPLQPSKAPEQPELHGDAQTRYFQVLYTKYQPTKKLRKNKTFADGILEVKPTSKAALFNTDGKAVSQSLLRGYTPATLGPGSEIIMGGWELEVDAVLQAEQFTSGSCFLKPGAAAPLTSNDPGTGAAAAGITNPVAAFKRPFKGHAALKGGGSSTSAPVPKAIALHDPLGPTAIVLNAAQWNQGKGVDRTNKPISPVVVDPYLARRLRPHQVEGVRFLYQCVMGVRDAGRLGAILADEMGLGKTIQVLALVWTLLKQGPAGRPAISKVLVVTPSSLTRNWAEEAKKWLGDERLRTLIIAPGPEGAQQALDFKHGHVTRVGIVSYETLRKHAAALTGVAGLLIADEGHRLKSAGGSKTITALMSLQCPRHVLLTGTPIQNDLGEFYAMASFVCPDALGTLGVFNRVFGGPIAKSRDKNASTEEKALGAERSRELTARVQAFVLRRTAEVNAAYLPPLSLYVVFCAPSPLQLHRISGLLGSSSVKKLLNPGGAAFGDQALSVLTALRKLCNHPALLPPADDSDAVAALGKEQGGDGTIMVTSDAGVDAEQSGKMATLCTLLHAIITTEQQRCVVVSQSTAMLDLISAACVSAGYTTVRIDGKVDVSKRQDVVNSFNDHGIGQVFLLSTTAGGAGLNLIGANRLVLVDSHWNPAMDLQAMARIWRDRQTKPCVVYRLLTTGTVEEKIYQRQRAKADIAAITMGGGAGAGGGKSGNAVPGKGHFSREELRQLFTLRTDTKCDTAETLATTAAGADFVNVAEECGDGPLAAAVAAGTVTFVHLDKGAGQSAGKVAVGAGVDSEQCEGPSGGINALGGEEVEGEDGFSDGASQLCVNDDEEEW